MANGNMCSPYPPCLLHTINPKHSSQNGTPSLHACVCVCYLPTISLRVWVLRRSTSRQVVRPKILYVLMKLSSITNGSSCPYIYTHINSCLDSARYIFRWKSAAISTHAPSVVPACFFGTPWHQGNSRAKSAPTTTRCTVNSTVLLFHSLDARVHRADASNILACVCAST